MRLDKFLAMQGLGTRTEVRGMIKAGRVWVDGQAAKDAAQALTPETAQVVLDGVPVPYQPSLHIMLHKPSGVLTAAQDRRQRTVMDLLPQRCMAMGCMPVGRLDKDTEGLLILTTDGQLAHRLLSPRRHVDKVYYAQVDSALTAADVAAFAGGLALSDFTALPAGLDILPDGLSARVTVREGKFHQVRRMFQACGKTVLRLKRLSFGGVSLDDALPPGGWRPLTAQEHAALTKAAEGMYE